MEQRLLRVFDVVLSLFYFSFVFISVSLEGPVCFGEPVSPNSPNYFIAQSYDWGLKVWLDLSLSQSTLLQLIPKVPKKKKKRLIGSGSSNLLGLE